MFFGLIMREIKILFLILNLLLISIGAEGLPQLLVAEDGGPSSDVITLTEVGVYLVGEGYDVSPAMLDSEVTKDMLDDRVTTFVYQDEAVIIVGEGASNKGIAGDILDFLEERGVGAEIKSSDEITSDDLRNALEGAVIQTNANPEVFNSGDAGPELNMVADEKEQTVLTDEPQEVSKEEPKGEVREAPSVQFEKENGDNGKKHWLIIGLSALLITLFAILISLTVFYLKTK
jgi:hypothetical protein